MLKGPSGTYRQQRNCNFTLSVSSHRLYLNRLWAHSALGGAGFVPCDQWWSQGSGEGNASAGSNERLRRDCCACVCRSGAGAASVKAAWELLLLLLKKAAISSEAIVRGQLRDCAGTSGPACAAVDSLQQGNWAADGRRELLLEAA